MHRFESNVSYVFILMVSLAFSSWIFLAVTQMLLKLG